MKKFICCFILLLLSFYTDAQSNLKLDSLKKVLAKLPKEGTSFAGDTMRVRVLCEMGRDVENFDLAKKNFSNAINISQKNSWNEGIYLANYYLAFKASDLGLDFFAIDCYFRALTVAEKSSNIERAGLISRRLGDSYLIVEDFAKAEIYYKKALQNLKKTTNKRAYLMSLNNLGLVYYNKKQFKEAIAHFDECLKENKIVGDKIFETYCIGNIGASYKGLGNYETALNYYLLNQKIENEIDNFPISDEVYTTIQIADLYLLKNDLKKSLMEIKKAEKKISFLNSYTKMYLHEIAYKVYKKTGKSVAALKNHELYISLKEMSSKQDYKKRIDALQFEYDNEKQRVRIEGLNKENEKNDLIQKILWSGLGLVLLFVGVQFWNNHILKSKNIQIESQKNEIFTLNQGLELKVLERTKELSEVNEELIRKNDEIMLALVEGQTIERKRVAVELHDNLGSMLSGMKFRLQALNKDKFSEKEQKIYEGVLSTMGEAYSEVRLISHNLLPAELEKSGLKGALQKLVNDINQSEKLYLSFKAEEIKVNNKKVEVELYGVCLELVNNILKHSQATEASILIKQNKDVLTLTIIDNGIGLKPEMSANGIGAKNITARLNTISAKMKYLELDTGLGYQIEVPIRFG